MVAGAGRTATGQVIALAQPRRAEAVAGALPPQAPTAEGGAPVALLSRAVGVALGPSSQCRTAVERLRGPRAPPQARAEGATMRPGKTSLHLASRKAPENLAGIASTAWECHSNHAGLER